MTPNRGSSPLAFTVRVPESWIEFDVWRATRTGDLARLVDTRIAQAPELRPRRAVLLKLLREVASDAQRNGVLYCAAMADVAEDSGLLAATLLVFRTDGMSDPAENAVEAIAAQVNAVAPREGSLGVRRVELVTLPAGSAVRVFGVEAVEADGRGPVDFVMMQTLVPIPEGSGVLNLVLTSPQVQLAGPMLNLFGAISDTLSWSSQSQDVLVTHP